MKNFLKFIFFILYGIGIFFLEDFRILVFLFGGNCCLIKIWQMDLRNLFKTIKILLPFVVFTGVLNGILGDFRMGGFIMVRLLLAYQVTYVFSKAMTGVELANVIQNLTFPLKIFGVNNEKIGIIVSISLCVLPILKTELQQKREALKAKGLELKLSNGLIILKPLFISILRRTSEMEKSLIAKGYETE